MKALLFLVLATAAGAQSMSVNIGQKGAFQAGAGGGGVITGVVNVKTDVAIPPRGGTVVVGGHTQGLSGTSSQNGHTTTISNGAGGYSSITVTPIPVITGPVERPLTGLPAKQVVALLSSEDASDRLSAAAEIGRRTWPAKARPGLSTRLAAALSDEAPRVVGAAAHALAALNQPVAFGALIHHLQGREPDRIVPVIEALATIGDARAVKPLEKMAGNISLEISVAANRALAAIERRERQRQRARAPQRAAR